MLLSVLAVHSLGWRRVQLSTSTTLFSSSNQQLGAPGPSFQRRPQKRGDLVGPFCRREFFCRSLAASDWAQPLCSLRDGILAPRFPLQLREEGAARAALAEHHGEEGWGLRVPSTAAAHPKAEARRGSHLDKTKGCPPPTRANAQLSALPSRRRAPRSAAARRTRCRVAPTGAGLRSRRAGGAAQRRVQRSALGGGG